ncbi:MAG TPA: MBL fold metallo-hydrolase, partial [Clostridia bacterium]
MVEMVKVFKSGYCKSLEGFSKKGGSYLKVIKFPALWCLVKHSKEGYILFDTGYSDYVLNCTGKFPERLYSLLLPIYLKKGENAVDYLADLGIKPEEISYIIISHFHADHIGGLNYFKNCKFIYSNKAFNSIKDLSGISAVKKSFFKELIPADFQERSIYIENIKKTSDSILYPFTECFDVFGDKSLLLVPLEGHAKGQ